MYTDPPIHSCLAYVYTHSRVQACASSHLLAPAIMAAITFRQTANTYLDLLTRPKLPEAFQCDPMTAISSLFFFLRLHIHLCWQLRWPSDDRRFDLRPSPPPLSDTIKPIAKLPRFCFIRNTRFLLSFKLLPSNFFHRYSII